MQPSMIFMLLGGVTIASSCAIPNADQTKNFNGNQQQTKLPEVSIDHPNPESKSQLNAEEDIELFRMVPQSTTIPIEDLAPTRSTISNREQKKTSNGNNGEKNIPEVSTEITIPEPKSQLNAEEDIELFRMVPLRTNVPIEDLASEKIVPLPTRSPTPRTYTILNGEQKKTSNGATEITISEPKTQLNAEEDIELFRMVPQSTTIPREDLGFEKIVPLPIRSPTPRTYTILNGEQKKTSSEENKLPEVATSEPKTQLNAEEDIELFRSTTIRKAEKIVPLPTRSPTPGTTMITSTSHEENQGTKTTENIMPLPIPGNVSVECEVQPYSFGPRLSAQLLKILTILG
ncbi:uncharacterized protein [Drosophila pseudoobscura]|uniref:Uncharacterized protein n=1 Tax=Drosophila pseudoobscura pseudoobscura TaxID=46245 RepID=A0A6I8VDM5_DROPS|nr:uncharacterized protein LOC26532771 [Drosophila pseudoobscura]